MSDSDKSNEAGLGDEKCCLCDKPPLRQCTVCGKAVCQEHLQGDAVDVFSLVCTQCFEKDKK